jgi:hypothetical protein
MMHFIHKVLWIIVALFLIVLAGDIAWHIFISGLRVMMFGFKVLIIPAMVVVVFYMLWHAKMFKLFKK